MENSNVSSLKRGKGVVNGVAESCRFGKFVVCTMEIPWNLTRDKLGGTQSPVRVIMVESLEEKVLDDLVAEISSLECDTFVGIGGGQAIDVAKYLSWKCKKRLVSIPTIISVDAFVTPAAGIRRGSEVVYVGESTPDPLVIDYDLIRTAPRELNVAGVGDILSIHTATFDWELANKDGHSEYPFSMDDVTNARKNLARVMASLEDIANVTDAGVDAIVNGYIDINKTCLPAGHYRTEEGSEHYVFYALETKYQRPFVHGHIVGLGIYLMSRLQVNKSEKIIKFMNEVGLQYHPKYMGITRADLQEVLLGLREYVGSRDNLWYTVIDRTVLTMDAVDQLMEGLQFD